MFLTFLPFLGSGFVPTDSMPTGLRWFADFQPFTPIMETLRGLLLGGPIGNKRGDLHRLVRRHLSVVLTLGQVPSSTAARDLNLGGWAEGERASTMVITGRKRWLLTRVRITSGRRTQVILAAPALKSAGQGERARRDRLHRRPVIAAHPQADRTGKRANPEQRPAPRYCSAQGVGSV